MLAGAGSSAIKRLERTFRRLRLNDFQLDLRGALTLGMPYSASRPTSKPGRPRCCRNKSLRRGESSRFESHYMSEPEACLCERLKWRH